MAATKIYSDYDEFLNREDKSENGVSQEFASIYPNYEAMNSSNTACWECLYCSSCIHCNDCEYLKSSIGCDECRSSAHLTECFFCWECRGCKNCTALCDSLSCLRCTHMIGGFYATDEQGDFLLNLN